MKIRVDMTGRRFGRLVGIEYAYRKGGHAHWLFACDCGNETIASGAAVRKGNTSSCGCLHRQISAERLTIHGRRARQHHDPTYRAWQEINTYCGNPRSPRYRDFGAKGVRVCEQWKGDFSRFLEDMGERPDGTMLIRANPDGGFQPSNCLWIEGHR